MLQDGRGGSPLAILRFESREPNDGGAPVANSCFEDFQKGRGGYTSFLRFELLILEKSKAELKRNQHSSTV